MFIVLADIHRTGSRHLETLDFTADRFLRVLGRSAMEHYQEDMSLSMNLNDLLGRTPEAQICGSTPYSLCMLIPFNLTTKFGIVTVGAGLWGRPR